MKKFHILYLVAIMFAVSLDSFAQERPPVFSETFEDVLSGIPSDWDNTSHLSGAASWRYFRGGVGGSVCMAYRESRYNGSDFNILLTPEIDVAKDQMLAFDYHSPAKAEFEVCISRDGGATFESKSLTNFLPSTKAWTHMEFELPEGKLVLGFKAKGAADAKAVELYIDNVSISDATRCAYPIDLAVISVSDTSAKVMWDYSNVGGLSDYAEYELYSDGVLLKMERIDIGMSDQSWLFKGLKPDTRYSLRMRMDCSEAFKGKSKWSNTIEFTTVCGGKSLPITYSFDALTVPPSCWNAIPESASYSISAATRHGSVGKSLMVAGNQRNLFLFSEAANHEADDMEISFYIYNQNSEAVAIEIGLQTDLMNAGSYSSVSEVVAEPGVWSLVAVTTEYTPLRTAKGAMAAIWFKDDFALPLYIDNFRVAAIPSCPRPEGVGVKSFNHNSVTLEWLQQGETALEVYKVLPGDTTLLKQITAAQPVVDGLDEDTEYTLWFKSVCGAAKSDWSTGNITFRTLCDVYTALPFEEGFESGALSNCWDMIPSSYGVKWEISASNRHTGNYSMALLPKNEQSSYLVMPKTTIPATGHYQVEFYMYRDNSIATRRDRLSVYAGTTPDVKSAQLLGTVNRLPSLEPIVEKEGWYKYEFNIPFSGDVYVIFDGQSQRGKEIFIDDVRIADMVACPAPYGISVGEVSATTCKISWKKRVDESRWAVLYKANDEPLVRKEVDKPFFVVENLEPDSIYNFDIQVVTICGTEHSDTASNKVKIETPCEIKQLYDDRFFEDFSATTGWDCWTVLKVDARYSYAGPQLNDEQQLSLSGQTNLFCMPEIDIKNIADYRVIFDYSSYKPDKYALEVGIMSSLEDLQSFTPLDIIMGTEQMTTYSVPFDKYKGTGRIIAFRYSGGYDQHPYEGNYIDNVEVCRKSSCGDVLNMSLVSATYKSADFNVPDLGSKKLEARYGKAGFDINDANQGKTEDLVGKNNVVTLTGLEGDTEYDVYFRIVCSDDNKGKWSSVLKFRTKCPPVEVLYGQMLADGFEHEGSWGCWTAVTEGKYNWEVNYDKNEAQEGNFCAVLKPDLVTGSDADLYYPVTLKAGIQYEVSCYAAYKSPVELSIYTTSGMGVKPDPAFVKAAVKTDGGYARILAYVTPAKDAEFIIIKGLMGEYILDPLYVDNLKIKYAQCKSPDDVSVDNISENSARIICKTKDPWNVKISTRQINPFNDDADVFSQENMDELFIDIPNLKPNTVYYYYLQSVCGEDNKSEWTEEATFKTQCGLQSLPYESDFDTDASIECWFTRENGKAGIGEDEEGKRKFCSLSTKERIMFVSPAFEGKDGKTFADYMLSASLRSSEDNLVVAVGVMAESNVDTYNNIINFTIPAKNTWVDLLTYFKGSTAEEIEQIAGAKYICFTFNGDENSDKATVLDIDDLKIVAPDDCPTPTAFGVEKNSTDRATVAWKTFADYTYKLEINEGGKTLNTYDVSGNSKEITGLSPNTEYSLILWNDCNPEKSDSAYLTFTTLCTVQELPFRDDFESMFDVENKKIPDCWGNDVRNNPISKNDWEDYSFDSERPGTYMNFHTSSNNEKGNYSLLQTPMLNLKDVPGAVLSFECLSTDTTLSIVVSTDGVNFTDTIAKKIGTKVWIDKEYRLDEYVGKEICIGFHGVSAGNPESNAKIAIDNVFVDIDGGCPEVKSASVNGITTNSAVVNIDSEGTAWEILVGPPGFKLADVAPIKAATKSQTIDKLTDGTEYQYFVRSVCDGKRGRLSGPYSFVTQCSPLPLSYIEDFETTNNIDDLHCLYVSADGAVTNNPSMLISGERSLRFYNFSDWGNRYMVLPPFDSEVEKLMMTFSGLFKPFGVATRNVSVGLVHTDSIDDIARRFVPVGEYLLTTASSSHKLYFDNAPRRGSEYRIAFKFNVDNQTIVLDDINVSVIPTFAAPRDIAPSQVRDTSAVITWLDSPEAEGAELMLNDDETNLYQTADKGRSFIDKLQPGTMYELKVRGTKGAGVARQTTEWSDSIIFYTLHSPAKVPASCNFETDEKEETAKWYMKNSGGFDWVVSGADLTGVYEGEQALYVQYKNKNAYEDWFDNSSVSWAYRTLELEAGVQYSIDFMYHVEGSLKKNDYLKVYLAPIDEFNSRDIKPTAKWIALSENLKNQSAWAHFSEKAFVEASGYYNLVLRWENASGNGYGSRLAPAVDNFSFTKVNCSEIVGLAVDSVGITTARADWRSDNVAGATYDYAVVPAGKEFDETSDPIVSVAGIFARIDNLNPSATYRLYVRSVCPNGFKSDWVESELFTTQCAAAVVNETTSFADDFEAYADAGLGCWYCDTDNDWLINRDKSEQVASYSGDANLVLTSERTQAGMVRSFDLKKDLNYRLALYTRKNVAGYDNTTLTFSMGKFMSPDVNTVIGTYNVSSAGYVRSMCYFTVPADGIYSIAVAGALGNNTGFLSIDSLSLEVVDCAEPSMFSAADITTTSATVSWNGIADKYIVVIDGGSTHETREVAGNSIKLEQLSPSTAYTLRVNAADCPDNVAEFSFYTLCGAVSAPYSEDFDALESFPACWNNEQGNAAAEHRWNFFREPDGNGALRFDSHNAERGKTNMLKSPEITVPAGAKNVYISFDYKNVGGGEMNVLVSPNKGFTFDTLLAKVRNVPDWTSFSAPLNQKYIGKKVTFMVSSVSNNSLSSEAYHYIDNLSIVEVAETVEYSDTVCFGMPYTENGFDIAPAAISYGMNRFSRFDKTSGASTQKQIVVNLFVPETDYYVTDYFETGGTYTGNGFENLAEAGEYEVRLPSVSQCDSIIHLTLIEKVLKVTLNVDICEGQSYNFCGKEETVSGTYTCTRPNVDGKDSVTTLILNVLPKEYNVYDTICQGNFVEFGGEKYTEANIYTYSGKNHLYCDSVVHLHLHVVDSVQNISREICQGQEVRIGSEIFTATGKYSVTLPRDKFGCNAVVHLDLKVGAPDTVPVQTTACEGKPIFINGFVGVTVTKDTVMYRTDRTLQGCDSITRLDVKFVPTTHVFDTATIDYGGFYAFDDQTLVSAGDYTSRQSTAEYGCDSITHLHLIVLGGSGFDAEMAETKTVVIAPNPVGKYEVSYINVDLTDDEMRNMTVEIVDISGKSISRTAVDRLPAIIGGIPESGIYFVRLTTASGRVYHGRLIVK